MEWKDIKGYEGIYQVSNTGLIKSLPRNTTKGGILKWGIAQNGYAHVDLYKNGNNKITSVHRLVAEHFCLCKDGDQVMHLDNNKLNNHADNLRFGSQTCNAAFRIENGTDFKHFRLTREQIFQARKLRGDGFSFEALGKMFKVPTSTVFYDVKRIKI